MDAHAIPGTRLVCLTVPFVDSPTLPFSRDRQPDVHPRSCLQAPLGCGKSPTHDSLTP